MARALVVGLGSIGRRHARALGELDCDVAVVSRRGGHYDGDPSFSSLAEGLACHRPDYVVLARETARHAEDIVELAEAGFDGDVLVEKPLTAVPTELPALPFARLAVAYNLRFHPELSRLRAMLDGQEIATVTVHAGQHLSTWRPGTDYRSSYSADPAAGGGVLRDLSHELDYLLWLFGPAIRVAAMGGRSGLLDIGSDDTWAILLELDRAPLVSLQLDYLDRIGQRRVVVTTRDHTLVVDLVAMRSFVDGAELPSTGGIDTYRAQHEAMLGSADGRLCTLQEGAAVVELVAAIEKAAQEQRWVLV